jgi:hypothetical protein
MPHVSQRIYRMRFAMLASAIAGLAAGLAACAQIAAPNRAQLDADAIMAGMAQAQQGAASVFSTSPQFPGTGASSPSSSP